MARPRSAASVPSAPPARTAVRHASLVDSLLFLLLGALFLAGLLVAAVAPARAATGAPGSAPPDAGTSETWSQWRGPDRDGTVGGSPWPADLSGLELLWEVPLGKGYPGPIAADGRVFVVETVDETTEQVRALRLEDGEELWRFDWTGGMEVPFFAKRNGDWVRSTPAWDDGRLFVGGMQERFFALDAATGELLWKVDFPERFGTSQPDFGFASSPMAADGAVYVQAANSLVKLDAATGETLWRALDSGATIMDSGAFSSPVILELAGVRQLVVQTRNDLVGIDPETGTLLWSHTVPSFRGMNILTPTADGDRLFTSTHRNNSFLFEVRRDGTDWSVEEVWTHKAHGYMSSPILHDGHAYLHLGNRRVVCLDLETGADTWTSEPFGEYWSMVRQGDRMLALDADGTLRLLRANPERLEVIDEATVAPNSPSWGYLALSGDRVLVRELEGIRAYRWSEAVSNPPTAAP